MPTWIDCSGDEGFKFSRLGRKRGSSHFYVVAAFTANTFTPIKARMDELRGHLGIRDGDEIHFSEMARHHRFAALAALGGFDFEVHAMVVEKKIVWSPVLRNDGVKFRQFFCKELLDKGGVPLDHALVYIDPPDSSVENQHRMSEYLKRELNGDQRERISSIVFAPSHRDPMMQAVDVCAGAIRMAFEENKPEFRRLIATKIANQWCFK